MLNLKKPQVVCYAEFRKKARKIKAWRYIYKIRIQRRMSTFASQHKQFVKFVWTCL